MAASAVIASTAATVVSATAGGPPSPMSATAKVPAAARDATTRPRRLTPAGRRTPGVPTPGVSVDGAGMWDDSVLIGRARAPGGGFGMTCPILGRRGVRGVWAGCAFSQECRSAVDAAAADPEDAPDAHPPGGRRTQDGGADPPRPGGRATCRGSCRRRRRGVEPRHCRRVGPVRRARAGPDAARPRRAGPAADAANPRHPDAGPHAHRARWRGRPGGRPRCGRGRLPGQAVRVRGAARPGSGAGPARDGAACAGRLLASTRRRLAVVTLLLIGALVLAIGAATAFIATRALDQDVERALEQAAIAESQRLAGELPTAGEGDERPPGDSDTFFLILGPSGGVVSNPSGVPRQGLPDVAAVAAARVTGRDLRTVQDGAVPIRLLTLPIGEAAAPVGWLEAGFVLTAHERQSRTLILAVALVGLVGLAGAALVTLFVTGRALVPIRAAFATERRFVADASHEIRTPAAIIRASAEVLEREGLVVDEGRPLVADIVAEADRLGGLVDDLLALAASERGSLVIERRPIDLAEIARDTVRRAGPLAAERGIDLVGPAEDGTVLPVVGDTNRLVQLLLVLVDNASRHSPPGGRVTVTAGPGGGRTAAVSVDDQGPGVPAEAREAIFEPFARLPGSRTRADAGSGLGLAIARRLAELHGGTPVSYTH